MPPPKYSVSEDTHFPVPWPLPKKALFVEVPCRQDVRRQASCFSWDETLKILKVAQQWEQVDTGPETEPWTHLTLLTLQKMLSSPWMPEPLMHRPRDPWHFDCLSASWKTLLETPGHVDPPLLSTEFKEVSKDAVQTQPNQGKSWILTPPSSSPHGLSVLTMYLG